MNRRYLKYIATLSLALSIGMAVQRGSTVYVYDEHNRTLWSRNGELYGYTGSVVTIKSGSTLYMYNERGSCVGSRSAR